MSEVSPLPMTSAATIARLRHEVTTLREELAKVQRRLEDAQRDGSAARAGELVEANEQLVLATLDAETTAETAVLSLDELTRASQRDPLTDTPNRSLMLDRLQSAIAMAQRHRTRIALLFIDLDYFKEINDTLGHAVGDEVLRLVARRLESAVRHSDTVSRHSGDEFLVLLAEVAHGGDPGVVAGKILSSLAEPGSVQGHDVQLSASIGISVYPDDGEDSATLINRADAAMYRSKRRGRGCFAFYNTAWDPSRRDAARTG